MKVMNRKRYGLSIWSKVFMFLIYFFLYAPLLVMVVFSFNSSKSTTLFDSFSVRWYGELFSGRGTSGEYLECLRNSLILAVLSAVIATVLGTLAAVGIYRLRSKRLSEAFMMVNNIPMMNPDIVTGVALMIMFVFVGTMLGVSHDKVNFTTLLIAHITFNIPYVLLNVLPKLRATDPSLNEAAMDLGCSPIKAFFKAVMPQILPGVISGLLMAFTLSFDDFVISYYASGSDFVTLPIKIYTAIKKPVKPNLYALYSIIFVAILLLMIGYNILQNQSMKTKGKKVK